MITAEFFNKLFPTTGLNPRKFNLVRRRDELIAALNKFLPEYGIDSYLRVCAFLANCGIETDYFRTTTEYASGWAYDISVDPAKAKSLGNFHKGDGPKFKGSGLSQTTGGFNFAALNPVIGAKLGIDFTKNPEKLREDIDIAVESACIFWDTHDLNKYADAEQFKILSAIVNRGDKWKTPRDWDKRLALYTLLKKTVPPGFTFSIRLPESKLSDTDTAPVNDSAPVVLTPTETSPTADPAKPTTLSDIGSTVFLHTPHDTVKNIFVVIGVRILAGLVAIWNLGLHGKIFLAALAAVTAAAVAYACIKYAPRLLNWLKQAVDYVFKEGE